MATVLFLWVYPSDQVEKSGWCILKDQVQNRTGETVAAAEGRWRGIARDLGEIWGNLKEPGSKGKLKLKLTKSTFGSTFYRAFVAPIELCLFPCFGIMVKTNNDYHYLKIITRNDDFSILDPLHCRNRFSRNRAFELDVHTFIGIEIWRMIDKPWWNCKNKTGRKRS